MRALLVGLAFPVWAPCAVGLALGAVLAELLRWALSGVTFLAVSLLGLLMDVIGDA